MTINNETVFEQDLSQLGLTDLSDLSKIKVEHIFRWTFERYVMETPCEWEIRYKHEYQKYIKLNQNISLLQLTHKERVNLRSLGSDISKCYSAVLDKHKEDLLTRMTKQTPYHIVINDHFKVV